MQRRRSYDDRARTRAGCRSHPVYALERPFVAYYPLAVAPPVELLEGWQDEVRGVFENEWCRPLKESGLLCYVLDALSVMEAEQVEFKFDGPIRVQLGAEVDGSEMRPAALAA